MYTQSRAVKAFGAFIKDPQRGRSGHRWNAALVGKIPCQSQPQSIGCSYFSKIEDNRGGNLEAVIYRGTKFSRGSLWSQNRGERSHNSGGPEEQKSGDGRGTSRKRCPVCCYQGAAAMREITCGHAPRDSRRPLRRQTSAPWFPRYFPFVPTINSACLLAEDLKIRPSASS